jgi:DNA-binding YbaB/EbfC family protein
MPRQPRGGPGGQDLLRQVQELQEKMRAEQDALGDEIVEVSVGGGAITVVMTGHQRLTDIRISPELLDPEEHEMLTELLLAAVNQAVEQSQAAAAERMGALTRGLNLPPGLGI